MMFLKRPPKHGTKSTSDHRRRAESLRAMHRAPSASDRRRVARAFYCDALRGREVWDTERSRDSATLCFIVSGQRVDVSTEAPVGAAPLILSVGNPQRLAERCWDAGFSVHVDNDLSGSTMVSVTDPFGRRIDLVP
jgi:catechol 2,3-dioxygenase-like lactoylglutathione lyase family enzyme